MSSVLIVILVFGILILVHELGHFTVAKMVGIKVYEFSIGFGPKVFGSRKGETLYVLRALPLGGYVRMAGMDVDEDLREIKKVLAEERGIKIDDISEEEEEQLKASIDDKKAFNSKKVWQRVAVIFAGAFNNFILALVLFFLMFYSVGIPMQIPVVDQVVKGRPAEKVDFKPGDRIVAIDGVKITKWDQLTGKIQKSAGKNLKVVIERDSKQITKSITPVSESGRGMIGIVPKANIERQPLGKSVSMAYDSFKSVFGQITHVLGSLFVDKNASKEIGGPVSLFVIIGQAAKMGLINILFTTAVISVNLGIFNLLPIPALDGSRIVFLLFEGLRGRPVDPNKENLVHLIGFGLLMLLVVVVTYRDILRYTNLGG